MKTLIAFVLLSLPAFAQVTTINGSDKLKDSRAVINTNFSNLQSQKQDANYVSDSGAADAYVVTLSPAPGSLTDGLWLTFKAAHANATTTPTLNVNGLGAKTIVKQQNVALAANDIVVNGLITVRYETTCTCFQMQSNPGTGGAGSPGATGAAGTNGGTAIGYSFDGGGVALTTSAVGYLTMPFSCAISAWNMAVDTGTATVDVWKIATGTAIPTVTNTITASALPAISTGTAKHSTTLTGWTTAVATNDIFGFKLSAVSSATFLNITLECH